MAWPWFQELKECGARRPGDVGGWSGARGWRRRVRAGQRGSGAAPSKGEGAAGQRDGRAREAVRELFRGRLGIVGPVTAVQLAASLDVTESDADIALAALESEGMVLRGQFSPRNGGPATLEWCDRRLLARIHRYTLQSAPRRDRAGEPGGLHAVPVRLAAGRCQ